MTPIRVFVNGIGLEVADGVSALDALRTADRDEAAGVTGGTRIITDSRGLPVHADSPVYAGAIYRTMRARVVRDEKDEKEKTKMKGKR